MITPMLFWKSVITAIIKFNDIGGKFLKIREKIFFYLPEKSLALLTGEREKV